MKPLNSANGGHGVLRKVYSLLAAGRKIGRVFHEEFRALNVKLLIAKFILTPLPPYVGSRLRTIVLRGLGFKIGEGTLLWGMPTLTGENVVQNLKIGRHCWMNVGCLIDAGGKIFIGDHVSIGHRVILLTGTHHLGGIDRRAGPYFTLPIKIGEGAWIGANAVILPGVTIGEGTVIGAGAVVTKDIPPHVIAGGNPAAVIRHLDGGEKVIAQ